jgi:hypothetical protein
VPLPRRSGRPVHKKDRSAANSETAILDAFKNAPEFAREVGLNPDHSFDVEELRNAMRIGPDGQSIPQVLISLTQTVTVCTDWQTFEFPGGSSLIIDLTVAPVRYCVAGSSTMRRRESELWNFSLRLEKTRCMHSSLGLIPAVPSPHFTSSHGCFNLSRKLMTQLDRRRKMSSQGNP